MVVDVNVQVLLTAGVVGSSQKDTTSGFLDADNVRRSRGAENAVLSNDELLDTVGCANLCNDLSDLGIPVATITANDEE